MSIWDLFFLAVGLSMDACAVSVCKGLALPKFRLRNALVVGVYFGLFQAFMPLAGYLLGIQFDQYIGKIDHWIAFALLSLIGLKMIHESRCADDGPPDASLQVGPMLVLSIATSIDALAVGVTFAFLDVSIIPAISLIGVTTFFLSALGVRIGHMFGARFENKAELVGGLILIGMGAKILFEHMGWLGLG